MLFFLSSFSFERKRLASPLDSLNRHSPIYIDRQTKTNFSSCLFCFFCFFSFLPFEREDGIICWPPQNTRRSSHITAQKSNNNICFLFLSSRLHTRRRDTTQIKEEGGETKKQQEPNNQTREREKSDRLSL